jgi:hypothetical protein
MQPLDLIVIISVRFTRANSYTFPTGVSAVHYLSAVLQCFAYDGTRVHGSMPES